MSRLKLSSKTPALQSGAEQQSAPAQDPLAQQADTLGNAAMNEQLGMEPAPPPSLLEQQAEEQVATTPVAEVPQQGGVGGDVSQELGQDVGSLGDGKMGVVAESGQPIVTHEVKQRVTETISGAPDPYGAWNGEFGWDSKFQLVLDPNAKTCTIVVRIHTGASDEVKKKWETAIETKWGGKFALEVAPSEDGGVTDRYDIDCDLQFVDDAKDAHYRVTANDPAANEGGRSGQGGTTSMTGWGVDDDVDVTHEFGHMLGAVEDYFVTNGHDHTHGGTRAGFRDEGGGIMNNPADDPFAQHYELVRAGAARALGVDQSRCTVK